MWLGCAGNIPSCSHLPLPSLHVVVLISSICDCAWQDKGVLVSVSWSRCLKISHVPHEALVLTTENSGTWVWQDCDLQSFEYWLVGSVVMCFTWWFFCLWLSVVDLHSQYIHRHQEVPICCWSFCPLAAVRQLLLKSLLPLSNLLHSRVLYWMSNLLLPFTRALHLLKMYWVVSLTRVLLQMLILLQIWILFQCQWLVVVRMWPSFLQ